MSEFPTDWQRKTMWNALTAVSMLVIAAIAVLVIWLAAQLIGFLQPLLIPVALAGVIAYLLEPVVRFLCQRGLSRLNSVIAVFVLVTLIVTAIFFWVAPTVYRQGVSLAARLPDYTARAHVQLSEFTEANAQRFGLYEIPLAGPLLRSLTSESEPDDLPAADDGAPAPRPDNTPRPEAAAEPAQDASATTPAAIDERAAADGASDFTPLFNQVTGWLEQQMPSLANSLVDFLRRSVGGFFGAFGFLLSLILVPVYLFFFLKESPTLSREWSRYLPLRSSGFKDEVVATLNEINGYLMNFFRGQLVVSLIDGVLTAIGLLILGLEFALLIGLMVGVLGLIPFIGILLCWLPAVLIALVQWPGEWIYPVVVTIIFIVVQQLEGLLISPKIVGESVGLHPLTVIISMLAWSLLLGGLLGAILAVPLTATLKVLLKRYVWEKRVQQLESHGEIDTDTGGDYRSMPP